jgi:hypothetical protein
MMHVTTVILFVHLALYRLVDRRVRAPGRSGRRPAIGDRRFSGSCSRALPGCSPHSRPAEHRQHHRNDLGKSLTAAANAALASDPSLSKDAHRGLRGDVNLTFTGARCSGLRRLEDRQVPGCPA